ncbi:MAG TPA: hypothetical protein PKZ32_17495 [Candidatus Melainabacteria bacterium]|nr:hypothetical protein [Candidatus Melainabacteria bacterium]
MKFLTAPEKEIFQTQSISLTDADYACESGEQELLPKAEKTVIECVTYGLNDLMTGITLTLVVIALRLFIVHRQAVALTKSKYVLTESELIACGPDDRNDWKLPVSEIERTVLLGRHEGRHDLVIKTAKTTRVLAGLIEPEKLLQILPVEIQAGSLSQAIKMFSN